MDYGDLTNSFTVTCYLHQSPAFDNYENFLQKKKSSNTFTISSFALFISLITPSVIIKRTEYLLPSGGNEAACRAACRNVGPNSVGPANSILFKASRYAFSRPSIPMHSGLLVVRF